MTNSTKSIFVSLSKIFLLFVVIGFFLPFTQEALWGGFSGEDASTGLGFLLEGTESELYSLFLCAILCFASIVYTVIVMIRNNKNLNSESVALDCVFVAFSIYAFIVSFYFCQHKSYGIGMGAIFMLIGLTLSFVFLVCALIVSESASSQENSFVTKSVFLAAPITILFSAFFMLVCQECFRYFDCRTIIPGVLAAFWFCIFKFIYVKKGKAVNSGYIIPLLSLNLLTSIGWGFIKYKQYFVRVLTGEGLPLGGGKLYLFFLVISEFALLIPLLMDKFLDKDNQ